MRRRSTTGEEQRVAGVDDERVACRAQAEGGFTRSEQPVGDALVGPAMGGALAEPQAVADHTARGHPSAVSCSTPALAFPSTTSETQPVVAVRRA